MDRNKRLAELLGICWHDLVPNDWPHNSLLPIKHFRCANCDIYTNKCEADINPDFAGDPRLVLRECEKTERGREFILHFLLSHRKPEILQRLLNTSGNVADEAIEFLEKEGKR